MKRLMRAGAGVLAVRLASAGVSFAFMLVLSRLLGVEGLGAFALATAVATVLTAFSRLGLDTAVIRFVAPPYHAGDADGAAAVARHSARPVLLASAGWAVVAAAAGLLGPSVPGVPDWVGLLPWAAVGIVPWSLSWIYIGLLFGTGASARATALQGLVPFAVSMAGVGAWWAAGRSVEPAGALLAWSAGYAVAAGAGWMAWRRRLAEPPTPANTDEALSLLSEAEMDTALRVAGRPLMWTTLLHLADAWAMPLIIGTLGGAAAAGLYATAVRYAYVMGYVSLAVAAVVMPEFSRAFASGDDGRVRQLGASSARLIALASAPLVVGCLIWSGPLMAIYGEGFEDGAAVLVVLALGQFALGLFGLVGAALAMGGEEQSLRTATVVGVGSGMLVAAALTPVLGALGGALGSALAWVGTAAAGTVLLRRRRGVAVHLLATTAAPPDPPGV